MWKRQAIWAMALVIHGSVFAQTYTIIETMGTVSGTTAIATHETNNGFDQDQYTYSGSGDVRVTSPSSGYTGASGTGNIFVTNSISRNFIIVGINTNGCTSATLEFGIWKSGGAANSLTTSEFIVEYSTDGGSNWTALDWGGHTGGSAWILTPQMTLPNSDGLRIRFTQPAASPDQQVRIDDVTIIGNGSCASASLPITWGYFHARALQDQTEVSFQTYLETQNDYFSIERSADATHFEEIGQIKGAGDSNEPKSYTFTDDKPLSGKNYYRLKQVDFDGKYSYSHVVSVNFGLTGGFTLSPMPTSDQLHVTLDKTFPEDGTWQVIDLNGRPVRSGVFPAETLDYQFNAADLPEGMFVFRLLMGQDVLTKKFRKTN